MTHRSIPHTLLLILVSCSVVAIAAVSGCGDGNGIEIILPSQSTPQELVVYITGEVVNPGVYTLDPTSDRVVHAIEAAGGFTGSADVDGINLAARLTDGQHIKVPAVGDSPSPAEQTEGSLIDINTASPELLQTLTGIGPAKAHAIIDYREVHGPFARIEDIINVPGIGEATFESIKDHITAR